VTTEQIVEAQKAIADMRNVLTVLMDTTDVEKLAALVEEKVPLLIHNVYKIAFKEPEIFRLEPYSMVEIPMLKVTFNRPDEKLLNAVAKEVPAVIDVLDKMAQALRETATKAPQVA